MFLSVIDRYSQWPIVARAVKATASELISLMRQIFMTYGTPEEIVSDGGRQFVASEFELFLKNWKVRHHISSSYNPHSNLWQKLELNQ